MDQEATASSTVGASTDLAIENQSLGELMKLVDMYMKTLEFRGKNGTLSSNREKNINSQIDYIMEVIEDRQLNKKKRRVEDSAEVENNSSNKAS